jgi:hypothetical protein
VRVTQTILFAGIVLASVALPGSAATYYVGACKTGSYATISAAVNDPKIVAGSTINVCPGTYHEQVFISKSLNLQGVVSGNSGAATITGSTADQTFQTTVFPAVIRPSIVITSATVNITNIDIEQAFTATPACSTDVVGIYYGSGASGTVNHSNISLEDQSGCSFPTGDGVWIENAFVDGDTVKVENSTIEVEGFGIRAQSGQPANTAPVLTVNVIGNLFFVKQSPSSVHYQGVAGIYLIGNLGTVSGNTIVDGHVPDANTSGIYLYASATVTGNTIVAHTGIFMDASGSIITNNKIRADTGITFGLNSASVSKNTFFGGYYSTRTGVDSAGVALYACPQPLSGTNSFFNVAILKKDGC